MIITGNGQRVQAVQQHAVVVGICRRSSSSTCRTLSALSSAVVVGLALRPRTFAAAASGTAATSLAVTPPVSYPASGPAAVYVAVRRRWLQKGNKKE